MCTLVNKKARTLWASLGASALCLVIFLVYDPFSHGVRSGYMTYLFAWPLGLGAVPAAIGMICPRLRVGGKWAARWWYTGTAAVTVGSLLRGILEIAGTASVYQEALMGIGLAMLLLGALCWLIRR